MSKVRVLIAEDESIVAIDLRSRLESHGYDVVKHVLTGEDAINQTVKLKPDIVLMDIHLKDDIDGIEAARKIREKLPIPIIFLTAYADNETLERAKLTDVFGYIIKPYQERELFVNIEIALFKYQMEEKLKSSRIRLDTTLKSISDAVITTDASGKIDFMNTAAEKLFGKKTADCLGRAINRAFETDITKSSHVLLIVNDVPKTYEVTESQILDEQQDISGDVYILRDVSLRQEYENHLRKAKKEAEEASMLKSDFLANMSHELRTPLNSILGLTELSLETESEDERKEYLTIVKQAGESLLALINSILDFSKIEAGKMKKEEIPFDLLTLMEDTIERLYIQAHKKNIQLTLFFHKDCPLYYIGDSHKLFQILVNLIGNSIKFTDGGYIHLEVSPVLKDKKHMNVLFRVIDTGKGIPPEKMDHIFDSFTQVDSSSTRIHGGTGLGLAIVKKLIELLNGTITVESELGKGSIFSFKIPFKSDNARANTETFRQFPALKAFLQFSDDYTGRAIIEDLKHFGIKARLVNPSEMHELIRTEKKSLFFFDSKSLHLEQKIFFESEPKNASGIFVLCEIGEQSYWRDQGYNNILINPLKVCLIQDQIMAFHDYLRIDQPKIHRKKLIEPAETTYKILLLEDDSNNRLIAEKILKQRGHEVLACEDGQSGLKKLSRFAFDLLLVDIQMPDMDGIEFTRIVRNSGNGSWDAGIPIIAVTAHAIGGYREKCEAVGMNGFISKPYTVQDFLHIIENTMDRSRQEQEKTATIDSVLMQKIENSIDKRDLKEIEHLCMETREHMLIDDDMNENLFRIALAARRSDFEKIEQLWQLVMETYRSRRIIK